MTEASPDTPTIHDVAIVGSGPAGYTAAIYAARADLQPIVFEGIEFGGSLMTTTEVENYPGFAEGIMGPELMEQMRTQAERFGADLRMELVDRLEVDGEIKKIFVGDEEFQARTVILAMGSAPRYLGVPGEQELLGRGVSSCATCDGFFFRDQDIAVIGGGDSAMEEALFLTRFAKSVMVVHRRDEFRASAIMLERARANEKITFVTNAVVDRVLSEDNKVSGLELKDTVTGETRQVDVAAMFVAIGADPRSELVKGQVDTDASGHVLVAHPSTKTNVPSLPQARVHARLSTPSTTSFLKLTHQFIHSSKGKSCLRLLPSLQRTFVLPLSILLPPFWSIFGLNGAVRAKNLPPKLKKLRKRWEIPSLWVKLTWTQSVHWVRCSRSCQSQPSLFSIRARRSLN